MYEKLEKIVMIEKFEKIERECEKISKRIVLFGEKWMNE